MDHILDLDRFPIDRVGGPAWTALVGRCRAALAEAGMFHLPGLVRPRAVARIVAGVEPRLAAAFTHRRRHNIYFQAEVPGLAPDHPALRRFDTVHHTLCADQLPEGPLLQLYRMPSFAAFLAAAMDKPALHVMADPLACVNVMAYREGEALNWHFDRAEFTTTLVLQAPAAGGVFQYRRTLRADDDPNYNGVARLLDGDDPELKCLGLEAGTLTVFGGRHTAHRVTPVIGDRPRIVAVLSYYERPGVMFSPEERIGFYGRAN